MNKKVGIGLGIGAGVVAVVLVAAGITNGWFYKDEPANGDDVVGKSFNTVVDDTLEDDTKYVGEPVPNIVNRAGTVKKIKNNCVVINGADDEDIYIYVDDDTEIYGADGSEKEFKDLKKGIYITVDIDGDGGIEAENRFDASVIYISGK